MPFYIRQSTIENAGEGMFAAREIAQNSILGIYSGLVGTHEDINIQSNSLFHLGWYFREGWGNLLLDG